MQFSYEAEIIGKFSLAIVYTDEPINQFGISDRQ